MSQYFDNDTSVKSTEKDISYTVGGKVITLKTDNGVFSKSRLDEGTYALIKVLLPLNLSGNVLDVGCGYGALGLTIAYLNPNIVMTCSDVNLRALNLCKTNAEHLQIASRVTCLLSDVYQHIEGKFSSILINPPIRAGKKTIYAMYQGAKDYLLDGGSLFIVIRKSQGANSSKDFIESVFGNCTLLKKDKGYYIYQATK